LGYARHTRVGALYILDTKEDLNMKKTIEALKGTNGMIRIARFALCLLVTFAVGSTMAYGQASKTLVNSSTQQITVTLLVRSGADPAAQAGSVSAKIAAGASKAVTYGTPTNIYLNGVSVTSGSAGDIYSQQATITTAGSTLDSTLNSNSFVVFTLTDSAFEITGHN
jgi:hypothetical protein